MLKELHCIIILFHVFVPLVVRLEHLSYPEVHIDGTLDTITTLSIGQNIHFIIGDQVKWFCPCMYRDKVVHENAVDYHMNYS